MSGTNKNCNTMDDKIYEKTNYINTVYFQRLRDAVDDIYKHTSGDTPLTKGFASINPNELYRKCVVALTDEGFVKNYGTQFAPNYVWDKNKTLTESVYHRVYKFIRELNKKYNLSCRANKSKSEEVIVTVKPEKKEEMNETKTLAEYTDVELWEELKRREYKIQNGKLVKVTYQYLD